MTLRPLAPLLLAAGCSTAPATPPAQPLGIAWGMIYGPPATATPAGFLPAIRSLGGGFTKVNLTWGQLQPQADGPYDWELLDAYLDQLQSPEEGMLSLLSASPWATRTSTWFLPPSPARDLERYRRFVGDVVAHARGRIRYFQSDSEVNNPLFWAGSPAEYLAQLRVFHAAVKEADPHAQVVLGGSDGLFDPTGRHPMPGQEASLALLDAVLAGGDLFDVFDLHLYADPYTIPDRVGFVREKLAARGLARPIIASEYNGPGFFEFPANRRYFGLLQGWAQSLAGGAGEPAGSGVAALYQGMDGLAPETRMFLLGCPEALDQKLRRIQARDLVMRNVLALAAGVQRTAFWDLWHDTSRRDDVVTLLYGKLKLMEYSEGTFGQRYPLADAFQSLAAALAGAESVRRLPAGDESLHLFEVSRRRGTLYVAWRRGDAFAGEDEPPVSLSWPASLSGGRATDIFGQAVPLERQGELLRLQVSVTPVFVEGRE